MMMMLAACSNPAEAPIGLKARSRKHASTHLHLGYVKRRAEKAHLHCTCTFGHMSLCQHAASPERDAFGEVRSCRARQKQDKTQTKRSARAYMYQSERPGGAKLAAPARGCARQARRRLSWRPRARPGRRPREKAAKSRSRSAPAPAQQEACSWVECTASAGRPGSCRVQEHAQPPSPRHRSATKRTATPRAHAPSPAGKRQGAPPLCSHPAPWHTCPSSFRPPSRCDRSDCPADRATIYSRVLKNGQVCMMGR